MQEHLELVSALVDGEPVDAQRLATALAAPGVVDVLVDFVALRAAVAFAPGASSGPRRARPVWSAAKRVAAAAVLALAMLGGLDLWTRLSPPTEGGPPEPSRVVHFEPGVDWQTQGR